MAGVMTRWTTSTGAITGAWSQNVAEAGTWKIKSQGTRGLLLEIGLHPSKDLATAPQAVRLFAPGRLPAPSAPVLRGKLTNCG